MSPYGLKPHRGGLILAIGLIGVLFCGPLGIAAWLMGRSDLQEMEAGNMDPTGRGLTNAGRILGMIAVAFTVLGLFLVIPMLF